MKKALSVLLSLCLLLAFVPAIALAAGETSGNLTDTITWAYANGTLTLTGSGEMPDYTHVEGESNHVSTAPWYEYRSEITDVIVGSGITKIGIYTFGGIDLYPALNRVVLPEGLLEIGRHCFYFRSALMECNLPSTLRKIGRNAFYVAKVQTYDIGPELTELGIEEGMNPFDNTTAFNCAIGAREFNVHPDNPAFIVFDGALYTKDMKALLAYPLGNTLKTTLEIPFGCEIIARFCMFDAYYLETVYIPATVAKIGMCGFNSARSLARLYFYGNCPQLGDSVFFGCVNPFDVFYLEGTTGWDSPVWDPYISSAGFALEPFEDDGRYPVINPVIIGDIDGNGEVGLTDGLLLLRFLAGWAVTFDELAADVNGDGGVTQVDAILILRHLAGWQIAQLQ